MDITYENFPLMQVLITAGKPGVHAAQKDFDEAIKGTDEDKFWFAANMFKLAKSKGIEDSLLGADYARINKTLESCLAVFEEIGARNHYEGAAYSAVCYVTAIGCKENLVKAAYWLEIAETLGGKNELTIQIAKDIEERTLYNVAKKLRPSLLRSPDGP